MGTTTRTASREVENSARSALVWIGWRCLGCTQTSPVLLKCRSRMATRSLCTILSRLDPTVGVPHETTMTIPCFSSSCRHPGDFAWLGGAMLSVLLLSRLSSASSARARARCQELRTGSSWPSDAVGHRLLQHGRGAAGYDKAGRMRLTCTCCVARSRLSKRPEKSENDMTAASSEKEVAAVLSPYCRHEDHQSPRQPETMGGGEVVGDRRATTGWARRVHGTIGLQVPGAAGM